MSKTHKDPEKNPVLTFQHVEVHDGRGSESEAVSELVKGLDMATAMDLRDYLTDAVIPTLIQVEEAVMVLGFPNAYAVAFAEERGLVVAVEGSKYVDAETLLAQTFPNSEWVRETFPADLPKGAEITE